MSEVMIPVKGGGGTSSDDVTASRSNILQGKTTVTSDSDDEIVEGTMPNCGAKTASLNCGGSYTIPAGYHNGSGKVTANSLASQTSGTAAAGNILKDKTAWVNGSKITGTIASRGAATITPGTANQTIAAGQYLSGAQTIKGDSNLKAANIALGVSIFGVSGSAKLLKCVTGSVTSSSTTLRYTEQSDNAWYLYWIQLRNLSITPVYVIAMWQKECCLGDNIGFNIVSSSYGSYFPLSKGSNTSNYSLTKNLIKVPIGGLKNAASTTIWYRIYGY